MTPEDIIADRFLDGLYYDAQFGDIVSFNRDIEEERVIILDSEGDEISRIDPIDLDEGDLYPIPEKAVTDPAGFYKDLIAACIDVDALDMQSYAAYEYVTDRVEIVEISE